MVNIKVTQCKIGKNQYYKAIDDAGEFSNVANGVGKSKQSAVDNYIINFESHICRLKLVYNYMRLKSYKIVEVE